MALNYLIKSKGLVLLLAILIMTFVSPDNAFGQSKRALLVGISNYPSVDDNSWDTINGTNDIHLIAKTLKNSGYSINELSNDEATFEAIRKALSSLASNCNKGDIVYIHFSCHGQPFEDLDGDEDDGWDESIIPYNAPMSYVKGVYEGEHHLTDDMLSNYFNSIRKAVGPSGFVCVVVDACHAGGSSRGDEDEELYCRGTKKGFSPNGKQYRPPINTQGSFHIKTEKGLSNITILEACRAYQSNHEIKQNGNYYGPLSYYVNVVLSSGLYSISDLQWVQKVREFMENDSRLIRQNMVYETSIR